MLLYGFADPTPSTGKGFVLKKLLAMLFAVAACASAIAPAALANSGRDATGSPGNGDNCTAYYQNNSVNWWPNGKYWHACD